jgi:hypothetical protein
MQDLRHLALPEETRQVSLSQLLVTDQKNVSRADKPPADLQVSTEQSSQRQFRDLQIQTRALLKSFLFEGAEQALSACGSKSITRL